MLRASWVLAVLALAVCGSIATASSSYEQFGEDSTILDQDESPVESSDEADDEVENIYDVDAAGELLDEEGEPRPWWAPTHATRTRTRHFHFGKRKASKPVAPKQWPVLKPGMLSKRQIASLRPAGSLTAKDQRKLGRLVRSVGARNRREVRASTRKHRALTKRLANKSKRLTRRAFKRALRPTKRAQRTASRGMKGVRSAVKEGEAAVRKAAEEKLLRSNSKRGVAAGRATNKMISKWQARRRLRRLRKSERANSRRIRGNLRRKTGGVFGRFARRMKHSMTKSFRKVHSRSRRHRLLRRVRRRRNSGKRLRRRLRRSRRSLRRSGRTGRNARRLSAIRRAMARRLRRRAALRRFRFVRKGLNRIGRRINSRERRTLSSLRARRRRAAAARAARLRMRRSRALFRRTRRHNRSARAQRNMRRTMRRRARHARHVTKRNARRARAKLLKSYRRSRAAKRWHRLRSGFRRVGRSGRRSVRRWGRRLGHRATRNRIARSLRSRYGRVRRHISSLARRARRKRAAARRAIRRKRARAARRSRRVIRSVRRNGRRARASVGRNVRKFNFHDRRNFATRWVKRNGRWVKATGRRANPFHKRGRYNGRPTFCPVTKTDLSMTAAAMSQSYGVVSTVSVRNHEASLFLPRRQVGDVINLQTGFFRRIGNWFKKTARRVKKHIKKKLTCRIRDETAHFHAKPATGFCNVPARDTVYLVIKGTNDGRDWLTNLNFFKTRCRFTNCVGRVHGGFHKAARLLAPGLYRNMARLRRRHPNVRKVIISGHSLGGAVAQLFALDALSNPIMQGLRFAIVTAGSPRVGDRRYHGHFRRLTKNYGVRMVTRFPSAKCNCRPHYHKDLVTAVPPKMMGFRHAISRTVWLPCVDWNTRDLKRGRGLHRVQQYKMQTRCTRLIPGLKVKARVTKCHYADSYGASLCRFGDRSLRNLKPCRRLLQYEKRVMVCRYLKGVKGSDARGREACERPATMFRVFR